MRDRAPPRSVRAAPFPWAVSLRGPSRDASLVAPCPAVHVPRYDFGDRYSDFCFNSLLTTDEVIKALSEIRRENSLMVKQGMFNMAALNKAVRLDELQQAQDQECVKMSTQLKDTWCTKIKNIIK